MCLLFLASFVCLPLGMGVMDIEISRVNEISRYLHMQRLTAHGEAALAGTFGLGALKMYHCMLGSCRRSCTDMIFIMSGF